MQVQSDVLTKVRKLMVKAQWLNAERTAEEEKTQDRR